MGLGNSRFPTRPPAQRPANEALCTNPKPTALTHHRPESMPRAMAKAMAELQPGAWLVSLEFEALAFQPVARLENVPGKPVWLYRVPLQAR